MASRRSHLTLLLIVIAALVGVALLGIPGSPQHRKLLQGLDLQGGLEVVLQAQPLKGQAVTSQMMDNAVNIMRARIDKLGVSEPVITKQGSNQIVIELPAVHDPAQAAKIIGQTAQLELYDLTPSLLGPSIDASQNPVAHTSLYQLLTRVQTGYKGPPSAYYLFNSQTERLVAGPDQTLGSLKNDPATLTLQPQKVHTVTVKTGTGKNAKTKTKVVKPGATTKGFPTGYVVLTAPNRSVVITCDSTVSTLCPSSTTGVQPVPGVSYYYLFKHGVYPGDSESPYP